jgi:DEAD/DEAH box helicase domain-containing protein
MDEMELELVKEAWLCPLTRTLLDTTLLGHTPYQPPPDQRFDTLARRVRMPVPLEAFGPDLRRWFENDLVVAEARAAGAISEFTERVLTGSPYYQVAEHSAQLAGSVLQKTEAQFKEGRLNLLSCSTTMEMGVDIGGLTGVAMNNAPPSPANFLQRVGRAGRRGENAALSLTVCRHLPHDQAVFAGPTWPFRTPMHISAVRLDSERIVERHVRAAALSRYLLTQARPDTVLRLECVWFFVPAEGQTESVCERLVAWLESGALADTELSTHLERITRATALDGMPTAELLAGAVPAFSSASRAFDALRRSLLEQRDALPVNEREDSPAAYAIRRQLARLEGEYLLGYLTDQQVLPGYGFPTGVVPFVTTTLEELKAIKKETERAKEKKANGTPETPEDRKERVDARTKLMGFPSRDLTMALREYAPGTKVVIDRRTYTPQGVTLNWHLPPEAGETSVRDVQALRAAWCCPMCGMTGTTIADVPESCPACAHPSLRRSDFLQPAGFAVDLYTEAEMDASPAVYMPVEDPWVSSGTSRFETLGTPTLLRARHTPHGEIVHLSAGVHGHGYALCLRCGRAEPEVEAKPDKGEADLPTGMKDHKRLRGGKGSNWREEKPSTTCEGSATSWAIRRHLSLGGSLRTDVLELQFIDPATGHLVADRVPNQVLLTTLAVALRKEAARAIGIDDRELGYQVAPRNVDGHHGLAVLLFDTASGGAGFCGELLPMLPTLLRRCVETCRCPRDCSGACHSCLLSHDTQHAIRFIDRRVLAPVAGEPAILHEAYLAALELRAEDRAFGERTALVWGEPHLAVVRQARRMAGPGRSLDVRLYAVGDRDDCDPVQWAGRHLVRSLRALGLVNVTLVLREESVPTDWQRARQLAGLLENEKMNLHVVPDAPLATGMQVWAELVGAEQCYGFAARADDLSLGADWAMRLPEAVHVEGACTAKVLGGSLRDPSSLVTKAPDRADLRHAASGAARKFGARFWAAIEAAAPRFVPPRPLDRVTYRDRYLQAPGAVQALYSVLDHLRETGRIVATTKIEIVTLRSENDRTTTLLRHNWPSETTQQSVIETLMMAMGSPLAVTVLANKRDTPHFRSLELAWSGGEVEIRPDQGFGFLEASRERFRFDAGVNDQVTQLLRGSWTWDAPKLDAEIPAYLVVRGR